MDNQKYFDMAVEQTLARMLTRAKTAPKAKGKEGLVYRIVEKEKIQELSQEVERLGKEKDVDFFLRDSKNILQAEGFLFIGARNEARGVMQCGYCGYEDCRENRENDAVCVYPILDLGIAVGSALTETQAAGMDTRVMHSIGKAAITLGWMEDCVAAVGIPLSITEKNIFFDRFNV